MDIAGLVQGWADGWATNDAARLADLRGASVLTVRNGKFASCPDYWDRNTLLAQLSS